MREDFRYPYRVISHKEEVEGNKAVGFFIGSILGLPIWLLVEILYRSTQLLAYISKKIGVQLTVFIIGFIVFYYIFKAILSIIL